MTVRCSVILLWYREPDLNRHERSAHQILSLACLPIPPSRQTIVLLAIYIAHYLLYTKNKEKSREMNDNNKKSQNNGLTIPQRQSQNTPSNDRNRAAIDFRRQKIQQIYQKTNTEQIAEIQKNQEKVHPEKVNLAELFKNQSTQKNDENHREEIIKSSISEISKPVKIQPKADFNSGVGQETDDFKMRQKVIQPLQNKQNIVRRVEDQSGAVNYKPQQAVRNSHTPQNDQPSEQWKRYHAAWQNYYQKYYETYYSAAIEQQKKQMTNIQPEVIEELTEEQKKDRALAKLRKDIAAKAYEQTQKIRKSRHFMPILSTIIVVSLFLFLQYNRLIFASVEAYVAPGNSNASQTIYSPNSSNSVGQEPKLIIPKINVDAPVIYGVGNDNASQLKAMAKGVAHFSIPGANAVPGQNGNTVLSGHSSNDLFDTGDYKFIFAQLDKLKQGDVIYANYNGTRYTYNVTRTEVVMPNQVNRVQIGADKPMLTLITCVPLGTAEKRLLVFAEQISPDPAKAEPPSKEETPSKDAVLPRNSLTFFERLFSWKWD